MEPLSLRPLRHLAIGGRPGRDQQLQERAELNLRTQALKLKKHNLHRTTPA